MKIEGYLEDIDFISDIHDPTVIYAEFTVSSKDERPPHRMFTHIDDDNLKAYIRKFVLPDIKEKVSVTELIQDVKDEILLWGNPDRVAPRFRTAGTLRQGLIEYDLNDFERQYVRINSKGWKISSSHKAKFLKRNTLGSQICPVHTDKNLIDLLEPLVNTDRDSLILFSCWLAQAFCVASHSALLIMAEQGSGKSVLTKMARRVVDPSSLKADTMPTKKDDLFVMLSNSYFIALDNTDELSKEISDIFCSAITGATMAKRKLYSTNELGVYELNNTLVLNGIDIMPSQSDLASRCLLLKLKRIDEQTRKTESELEDLFVSSLPEILGAIFNALSGAMKVINTLSPTRLPRMAEPFKELLAIATYLGVSQSEFERIYFANLAEIDKERSGIAVVQAVTEFMTSGAVQGRSIEDKVTNLFQKIRANYSGNRNDLPPNASHFSRKLKRERNALEAAGYTANFDDTFSDGTHLKIYKNK